MPVEKPWPPGIIERIEFVDAQRSVPMARPETASVPSKWISVVRSPGHPGAIPRAEQAPELLLPKISNEFGVIKPRGALEIAAQKAIGKSQSAGKIGALK